MPTASAGPNISDSAQINPGVIVEADIANSAVTKDKVATSAVGTDEILDGEIVNADIAAGAAIVDTKLAQITTAGKVSGAALTSLSSIPAGAGIIPAANLSASGPIAKQVTTVSLSSSTTETDIIANTNIPASTLQANNGLLVRAYWEILQVNTSSSVTFRLYYGGSVIASITHTGTNITEYGLVEFLIAHNGTSAQVVSSMITGGVATGGGANNERHLTQDTTSAVNSGNAQNIRFTVQGSAGNVPTTIIVRGGSVSVT